MRYPVVPPGVRGIGQLELDVSVWRSAALLQDGQRVPRGSGFGGLRPYLVTTGSGEKTPVWVKAGLFGLTQPQVLWGSQQAPALKIGPPIPRWAWLTILAPLTLVAGGLLGALVGVVGSAINSSIAQSSWPAATKVLFSIAVLLAAWFCFIVLATLVRTFL